MEIDVSALADLNLSIKSNTQAIREAEARKRAMAAAVSWLVTPGFAFTALPFAPPTDQFGPQAGWNWAVQRVTIAGLGATTDLVTLYRGTSVTHALGNNALFSFTIPVAGAVATWHPGGKGLILRGQSQDSLAVAGTFTGTTGFVSVDVVQVTDEQLPYYLL